VHLVVAADSGDPLNFIDLALVRIPRSELHLYCKGSRGHDPRCTPIANYGEVSHAFVSHIVEHYDHLAPVTVFTSASISKPIEACRRLNHLVTHLATTSEQEAFPAFEVLDDAKASHPLDALYDFELNTSPASSANVTAEEACRASTRPFGRWFEAVIDPEYDRVRERGWLDIAIFAVRAEQIKYWRLQTWQRLRSELERCREGVPQEADQFMLRAWKAMLGNEERPQPASQPQGTTSRDCPFM